MKRWMMETRAINMLCKRRDKMMVSSGVHDMALHRMAFLL